MRMMRTRCSLQSLRSCSFGPCLLGLRLTAMWNRRRRRILELICFHFPLQACPCQCARPTRRACSGSSISATFVLNDSCGIKLRKVSSLHLVDIATWRKLGHVNLGNNRAESTT